MACGEGSLPITSTQSYLTSPNIACFVEGKGRIWSLVGIMVPCLSNDLKHCCFYNWLGFMGPDSKPREVNRNLFPWLQRALDQALRDLVCISFSLLSRCLDTQIWKPNCSRWALPRTKTSSATCVSNLVSYFPDCVMERFCSWLYFKCSQKEISSLILVLTVSHDKYKQSHLLLK